MNLYKTFYLFLGVVGYIIIGFIGRLDMSGMSKGITGGIVFLVFVIATLLLFTTLHTVLRDINLTYLNTRNRDILVQVLVYRSLGIYAIMNFIILALSWLFTLGVSYPKEPFYLVFILDNLFSISKLVFFVSAVVGVWVYTSSKVSDKKLV